MAQETNFKVLMLVLMLVSDTTADLWPAAAVVDWVRSSHAGPVARSMHSRVRHVVWYLGC
jgi:hypothetical protein